MSEEGKQAALAIAEQGMSTDDAIDWDDVDSEFDVDEDIDCHAGNADSIVKAWQKCGMAGTEYCDFECKFARAARAAIAQKREQSKARRRSHTSDIFTGTDQS